MTMGQIKVFSLDILDKCDFEQPIVGDLANHDRDFGNSCEFGCSPAPFSGYKLVTFADFSNDDWLDDAVGANRLRQLG